jgi:hypothetical protein
MRRAVINGRGKKNDIRQSEARSSKQRFEKARTDTEKKAAQVSLQRMADIPRKKFTA